ncbi:MAG: DUF3098 domain-containing protein [Muribaculaceae bacterium]
MAVKKLPLKKLDVKKTEIKYSNFPLTKINFVLMAICGAMIVVGFLLMLGPGNGLEQFNEDIFSTRRIVVGPTISFLGFVGMAFAIIFKKKEKK